MSTLIEYAAHSAMLDEDGTGLLVLPHPADDLQLIGPSLHSADWDAVVADLATRGWQPLEADADELQAMGAVLAGVLSDGREVIALEPIGA